MEGLLICWDVDCLLPTEKKRHADPESNWKDSVTAEKWLLGYISVYTDGPMWVREQSDDAV